MARARMRALMRWLLLVSLGLLTMDVLAMRRIDPGEIPRLAPDEGLLVVDVETTSRVSSVRISKGGSVTKGGVLSHLDVGRTLQLYALTQGEYRWHEATLTTAWSGVRYQLGTNPEFSFKVQPGRITYAGELIIRARSLFRVGFHISNRTLPVIDWLESAHPVLYRDYPLLYTGHYPDTFAEFYRAERAAWTVVPADLNAGRAAPKPGELPLDPKLLWGQARVNAVALSPNGELLAESVLVRDGVWALELIDLKAGAGQSLGTLPFAYDELEWKDDATLIATGSVGTITRRTVFLVGDATNGKRAVRSQNVPLAGRIVDLLPAEPGRILFERWDSRGRLAVHRLDVSSPASIQAFQRVQSKDRLNTAVPNDMAWYADGSGQLRAAIAKRGEDYLLLHGYGTTFTEVLNLGDEDGFQPMGLSFDGELIYGLTDQERAQRDLVAFDPKTRSVTRTIFSKPGIDIVSPVMNEKREPVAARYYQGGRLVTEYFDERDRAVSRLLEESFPARTATVIDRSRDGRQLLLWVEASDRPPGVYHLDLDAKRASLIDETLPALASHRFAPSYVLPVRSRDGLGLEAYLTLPPAEGKRPLVVMPHGGPIGVADRLHFNREVQFLASLGYAVLQVNYRGSDGYGKAFREAGHRNHGTLIEDDIDAAITAALAAHPLDGSKMCTLGASYGGYSAMVSTIRWPGRFRCAVSLSGVSDRALFFTASDSGRDAKTRVQMERVIGNPNTDMAEMKSGSPLYRYRELQAPLMLVHGRDDYRVDFEHTRRLVRMLNLAGRSPVLMAFPGEGHDLEELANVDTAWTGVAGFLREHLGGGPVSAVPAASGGAH